MDKLTLTDYATGARQIVRGLRLINWGEAFIAIAAPAMGAALLFWLHVPAWLHAHL